METTETMETAEVTEAVETAEVTEAVETAEEMCIRDRRSTVPENWI